MNDTLNHNPEVPDPQQLDLFGVKITESQSSQGSTDSIGGTELHRARDPTHQDSIPSGNGETDLILTETQKELASALHRKSRALVSRNYQATIQEDNKNNNNEDI